MTTTFAEDITLEQLEDDPYPTYARLRREAPVAFIPAAGVWFVTSFDACSLVGGTDGGFAGAQNHPTLQRVFGSPNVLTSKGEEHRDLRTGIDPSLQPRLVNEIVDDLIRPVARSYLRNLAGRSSAELMSEYFEPISVDALRAVMGLDGLVDSDTLRRWFRELNAGISNFGLQPEGFADADRASAEIEEVVRPRLDELRRSPDESMLSHMLWAGREGDSPRSIATIMPSLEVILLGGMQEPGHAAGSTLLGLLGEPDQWQTLLTDPVEHIPHAVHEGLRWIAPIGAVERCATTDVEIGGHKLKAGTLVEVILASANRDESRYDDPDRFDMDRASRVNQAFGNGEHFCAGHFFARQVQHIMLEELVPALPGLRMAAGQTPKVTGWVFRAPKTFPVEWDLSSSVATATQATSAKAPTLTSKPHNDQLLEVTVTAMRIEGDQIVSIELASTDGEPLPRWEPGAHIRLCPDGLPSAAFSLWGDPADATRYRIGVLREHGRVANFVHNNLRVGDALFIERPANNFPLSVAPKMTFVAGGIGITPLLPMVRAALAAGAETRLVYCARTRERLAFLDELPVDEIELTVHIAQEAELFDLNELVETVAADGGVIYACGPESMLTQLESLGSEHELDVHVERFTGAQAHHVGDHAFALVLARSGTRLEVQPGSTALEVLEEAGYEIRQSCREGNCGSCETRVTAGTVDHRDLLLTPAQRARNDRMMVCVSRATDDEITLDL